MDGSTRGCTRDETVGQRIRRLRLDRGLSLRQLSSHGVSFTYLSRIESGARTPSVQVIRKLARKLGVSPEYLESGVELTTREELDLALAEAELKVRLEPDRQDVEREFRAIVTLAEREGELDIAAKAKGAHGLAAVVWGRLAEARALLEAATTHPLVTPAVFPDVYVTLVTVYRRLHEPATAVELCERLLDEAHPDDGPLRTMLATQLSHALAELGDFDRSEQVLEELQADLQHADPYARARLHWTLARVAAMRDERRLALRHMRAAITLLKETEDTVRLARAHVMCGLILFWGGSRTGVHRHAEAAGALLPPHADVSDVGMVKSLEALAASQKGDFEATQRLADEALELLAEDELNQPFAHYARGLAAANLDEAYVADSEFARALEIFERGALWREASVVARARADLWLKSGNERAVAKWRELAEGLEARIGSKAATR